MAVDAPCCWWWWWFRFWFWFWFWWWPSMTDEPEMLMLLEENDIGEAGKHKYEDSLLLLLLMLALRWRWGPPPDKDEFASVTRELAPTLGPEFATLFRTALFMSPLAETGPRFDRPVVGPGNELDELAKEDEESPWKKIPELEDDDCVRPPATRDGTMGGRAPSPPDSK